MTAVEPRLNAGDFLPGDVEEGPRASSSQAGLAAVKYGPKIPTTARPFQVGDRILAATRYDYGTFSGVIDDIRPDFLPDSTASLAFVWSDDDPEHSRGRRVIALDATRTAPGESLVTHVELWDGPINGAPTGRRTYNCGECNFFIVDDSDDVDGFYADVDEHEELHRDDDAAVDAWEALTNEPVHVPPTPALSPQARTASLSTSGGAVTSTPAPPEAPTQDHGPLAASLSDRTLAKVLSRPAHVPSIAMLDRDAAAQHLADKVEDLLTRFSENLEIFLPVRQALADYRETTR